MVAMDRDSMDQSGMDQLSEAVRRLSMQVQRLQPLICREEPERLKEYKEEGNLLEFTLVTGGLIKGKILWVGRQSLGISTDSDQNTILYKHAIAFIQEQAE